MRLIWLSDLHFVAEGLVQNHDPRVRLQRAVDHINEHLADAAFCVVSGDMVDRGAPADYAALAEILQGLAMPCLPMVGNHDDRKLLSTSVPVPNTRMTDFVQYHVETEDAVIIALDTQRPGSDAGEFCAIRRQWLDRTLDRFRDRKVLLFMHHSPMPLGLPMQDADNMHDGEAFLDLARKHGCVEYLCIGHVHRPVTGTVRGIPFTTMRSVLYQAPPPEPAWTWDSFSPAEEPPNLGVVTVDSWGINVQYRQFCPFDAGVCASR